MTISIEKLNTNFLKWCNNTHNDPHKEDSLKEYFNQLMKRQKFTKVFKENNNFKFK